MLQARLAGLLVCLFAREVSAQATKPHVVEQDVTLEDEPDEGAEAAPKKKKPAEDEDEEEDEEHEEEEENKNAITRLQPTPDSSQDKKLPTKA